MKNLLRSIRNSIETINQEIFTIHKKESVYLTKNQSPSTPSKNIKLSRNQYPELDKFFIRFFNSKPVQGRVSGKSLAFVIGAQNVGKTEYIEKNLNEIKKRKKNLQSQFILQKHPEFDATKSPESFEVQIQQSVFGNSHSLIIKKNYKEEGGQLNYANFVEDLQDQIVTKIHQLMVRFEVSEKNNQKLKLGKRESQTKTRSLLTVEIVKQIVIHEHAAEYIFIHIKDVIFAIIEEKDPIFLTKNQRQLLEEWNDANLYGGACTFEHFFDKLYQPLIQMLWTFCKSQYCDLNAGEEIQKVQIAIKLFLSVFIRIQYENRPPQFSSSWYQTGIETTNFLFDLLNFLSGTGKYIQALQKTYTKAETNQDRQNVKQFLEKSRNFILEGNHVDIILCIMNIDELECFKNKSKPFLDFFDHVICRTVNDTNIRKHFPIMIQIPNRAFLDDTLQLGKIEGSNPVIIEIPGYIQHYMKYSNLIQIFQESKLVKMFHKFGRNPHTWKLMIQNMAKGVSMNEIEDGNAVYQQKQKNIAEAKMNRLYTSARCSKYLDNHSLDFEIGEVLNLYSKINGMGKSVTGYVGTVLFKQAYFKSMLEENIFYHMYYLPYLDYAVSLPAYLNFYRHSYQKNLKRNNSWIQYRKWRWFEKNHELLKMDVRYKKAHQKLFLEDFVFGKEHLDLELWTTYYSPIKDYGLQYYNSAYTVSNTSLP